MDAVLSSATILNGLILGWSVAWPPGPVNAEIIRRGILPSSQGGGFWPGFKVGLGACTGDFLWALGVSVGAGALISAPAVRLSLGVISLALLLFLAGTFARNAWRIARAHKAQETSPLGTNGTGTKRDRAFLLGFTFVLMSPWSIGFWLAVVGSRSGITNATMLNSLVLAVAVVFGALAWGFFLCLAVKLGARIFSRPSWQIATQALTAIVMLYFSARLVIQLTKPEVHL